MKIICFALWAYLAGVGYAGFIGTSLPLTTLTLAHPHAVHAHAHAAAVESDGESDGTAQYEFQYAVHDGHTGDVKDQFEHRRGGYVTGRYSLLDADGLQRVVEYSADPLLGFTAEVRRELPKLTIAPLEHAETVHETSATAVEVAAEEGEEENGEWPH